MEKYGVSGDPLDEGRRQERARLLARFSELAKVGVKTASENRELEELSTKLRFFDLELDKKSEGSG